MRDPISPSSSSSLSLAVLALGACLLTGGSALAQKAAPTKKPQADAAPAGPTVDIAALTKKIKSGDPNELAAALDELRTAAPAGASLSGLVGETLAHGLTLPLTQAAIETLGDLEAEAGSAAVVPYTVHRDPKIRRAAVKTLARTRGKDAGPALRRALSDSDPTVRGTAASGLGALKARDAVPELFVALDHRVNEAAASIGQLCVPEQCETFAARVGALPWDVATSGLEPVLFRPTSEISDDVKVKIVNRVRDLKTAEAHKFLRDVQARWPKTASPKVKQAIDQAVSGTVNASGSEGGAK